MRPALPREILGFEAAHVADVAAAVGFSVRVDDLAIKTGNRNSQPIALAHDRRRVHREYDHSALTRFAHERNDAVLRIMEIDPLEAFMSIVAVPERGLVFVNVIQML